MKVLYGYRGTSDKLKDPVAAIGIFDGVHVGHKKVIRKVLNSTIPGGDRIVITFDPHPRTVLFPEKNSPRIMSLEHRLSIFEKMGLDAVVIVRFTEFLSEMSPEEFIKRVLSGIGTKKVYVGSNFYFGSKKSGDSRALKSLAQKYGIEVHAAGPVKRRGRVVSSTWLRKLISSGRILEAEKLLRRPVSVLGTVVSGEKRGRELGAPTANIDPHHEVIPSPGVYAVFVDFKGSMYEGVINIGFNPTFYGRKLKKRREPKVEVNLFDFEGNVYGQPIEIFFIKKLRREKAFRSPDKLKKQIHQDILAAKKILSGKNIGRKIEPYKRY